ncbi:hypothetical protein KL930_001161 [Ogataea haglerorum]|uniref:Uncharacterized protein n=1 Tax=Ogataea haglerorum TaxID=1937702 RepID=A0AAN6D0N9_9ASCO|nr:uncharacterized protein KL911_004646 [Ogataea haglerorum]KAG7691482.1 hypothetical protein KL915_005229 [Ogataea haglerorum]KAG7698383.1 hypothetical protein KL951_001647 [Ogataea haglerorum]KAG7708123.1 hypothetical protein KL950_002749 [Ogataea haglerorum]KAG7714883.1 hypothetical protein KL913_004204 [Ogataea haglerorum]KAG7719535.1 hypothetical protein KL949_002527 [Ogataea haglerorum]
MQQQDQDNPTPRQASPLRRVLNSTSDSEQQPAPNQSQEVLSQLLGFKVESWPHSQEQLDLVIQLKIEQERTKYEQQKSRNLAMAMELLNTARQTGIPPELIPFLYANLSPEEIKERIDMVLKYPLQPQGYQTPGQRADESPVRAFSHRRSYTASSAASSAGGATSVWRVNLPQQQQFQFHHWSGPGAGPMPSKGSSVDTAASSTAASSNAASVNQQTYPDTPSAPSTSSPTSTHKRKYSDPVAPTHQRQPSSPTKTRSVSLDKRQAAQNPLASPYVYRDPAHGVPSYPPHQPGVAGVSRFPQPGSPYPSRQHPPPYYYTSPYHQQAYQFPASKPQEPVLPPLRPPEPDDKLKSKFLINTPRNPPK